MANTNAVMVGGQVTEDPATIGYPQLTIKDNYGVTYNSSSGDAPCVGKHIVLLKNHGGTTYAAGSIRMGTPDIDSIAIGANTTDNKLSPSHTGAIAIGSYAMGYNKTNDIGYTSSVAIGTKAMYGNYNTSSYSVALGTESCSNTGSLNNNSVCIGNNAGNTYDNSRSVNIGSYTSNLGSSTSSVNIGTYAGVYNYGNSTVNVGYYAGRQTSKRYSVESVTIGPYAGSHNRSNMYGMVAIGSYAGFYTGSNRIYGNIYLGHMAGLNSLVSHSSTNANPSIIIGPFAGNYANTTTTNKNHFYNASPVIIGYFAGSGSFSSNTTDLASPVIIGTSAFYYDSYKNLSSRPSVVIGYMAGYNMDDSPKSIIIGNNAGNSAESLKYSICIGAHTCAYNYGNYDVRISPYGYYKDPSYGNMLRRHTSYLGYMGGLVNGGYVWNHINNYASSMSGLSYNELKYRLFNNSSIYANMYISPISRDFAQSGYEDTSIVLYADKVYGPTTEFSVLSDKRLKENIKPAKYGLKDIRKINVY
ncbi:hypothetical protein IJ707_06890, partial [bacterium]|nr:hypothetical protein [bacterium]